MAPKKTSDTKTQLIALRLPATLLKRVEKFEKKAGKMSTSDALRSLIESGLDAKEQGPPQPAWAAQLEELAARLNTDAAGAVEVLREYLEEPDQPDAPAGKDKPRRKGVTLRSIVGLG